MNVRAPRRHPATVRLAAAVAAAVLAPVLPSLTAAAGAAVPLGTIVVNDPPVAPHALNAFPARDFLSAEGQTPGDTVVFEVTHSAARGGGTTASRPLVVGGSGLAEVNHPGGTCWDEVTPDIVAGDTVRVVVTDSPAASRIGQADVTTVADVTATRPTNPATGTVVVTGAARAADGGGQLPLDQLEARLVAPGDTFARSGRRDMRAPGTRGATLAYDEPGSTTNAAYTATWTGLSDADVARALGAESMLAWLGRDPAAGTESTVHETGAGIAGGPAAPCTAPKERLAPLPGQDADAPTTPDGLKATVSGDNTVTLDWDAAGDNVGVTTYGVYRDGAPIFTVQNADASAPAPTGFVDRNVPAGTHRYTVDAGDAVDNRSAESAAVSATATTRAAGTPPAVNDPPTHPFTMFPSRDMVDVEGLTADQTATVEVIRHGRVVTDATGLTPDAGGLVEINHVGTHCWAGTTPDLRAGDQVRATVHDADGRVAWVDEARIANVTAGRAAMEGGIVTVHGTAAAHDGTPLPLGQIEQRMVSSTNNPFSVNGKRTLRADASGQAEGELSFDAVGPDNPVGIRWTARYPNLSAADQALAVGVESRVMWLGRAPLAGLELTIFENGLADPPGPATPDCVAPFEAIDTEAPSVPRITAVARPATREVEVGWSPSTDDSYVYGYRVFADGQQVATVGGQATGYTAAGVRPGSHAYAVEAFDSASARGTGGTDAERVQAGLGRPYGNTSGRSAEASVTLGDVQPPTVPQNLQVTNPSNTDPTTGVVTATRAARLVFDPATDDSGVDPTYEVFRDGVQIVGATPSVNNNGRMVYTDNQRTRGQTYRYAVLAKDAAGNRSARTAEVSVTIAADTQDPTFTGVPTATVPDLHGKDVVLTWQAATDDVGVTGYGVYRDGTRIANLGGTTLTYTDAGLAAGTYTYQVDAVDSAGNRSAKAPRINDPAQVRAAIANDPPAGGHTVIAYPARDFVEGDGYLGAGAVVVEVFRGGTVVGRATTTPDATGLVEVNHAGPGCWGASGYPNTPDIRPGDVVRITPVATGVPDQTTVAGVTVDRPVQTAPDTVVVHGTARAADGSRLPLDQVEGRMGSTNGTEFRLNSRKVLRAPGDGTIAYDGATSASWTATFTGLAAADVTRALNGDTVVNWLGRAPLVGNELTIAENGVGVDGGPAAGSCTAPLDPAAPLVTLSPGIRLAFGDQPAVPASTSPVRQVVIANAGSGPLTVRKVYLGGANPGDFAVTGTTPALPATLAPNTSVTVNVTFSPKAVGARSATLNASSDAANTAYQSLDLTGSGTDAAAPSAPTGLTRSLVDGATVTSTVPVRLSWNASTGTVSRYQLQRSLAGGTFTDVPAADQPGTSTTVELRVATGTATRFQVRACNDANCSAYTALAAFTLADFQENNKSVSFSGTWTRSALAGSFGGSVSSSAAVRTTATLKTTGTGFQLVSTRGPDRGNAEVWVDGTRAATVSLYAPSPSPASVVYTRAALANATHQVELRPLGSRTPPSTGNRVDLDGFIALR